MWLQILSKLLCSSYLSCPTLVSNFKKRFFLFLHLTQTFATNMETCWNSGVQWGGHWPHVDNTIQKSGVNFITFFKQLLKCRSQKHKTYNLTVLFALLKSVRVKAACRWNWPQICGNSNSFEVAKVENWPFPHRILRFFVLFYLYDTINWMKF
jgi:hypothetical protein